ncbi:MAG TPA: phenylalanine--tRNA ligase subunit beta [Ktedonobacteraceae bacterium]|jgi:phenylalanyl-tRNA synthetase beta chain
MLVPISWLKEYVDLTLPLDELAGRLSMAGMEVEEIKREGDWWDPATIVVGRVLSVKQHPNADRLTLVEIEYGSGVEQVVTGAPNLFDYKESKALPVLKVAFARNGAVLIDAYSEETPRPKKKLKASKIRGIASNGMVCSQRELGLSDEHEGILFLPEDAPVGMPLRDYLGNEVFEIALTPDMARCLSMIGLAREVAALTNAALHLPPDETERTGEEEAANYAQVEIANPQLCNRYIGLIIKDVKIGPSPKWMQERLTMAGMRPINNIVDITNYVMLEWGQPLHAFDYDMLKARALQSGQARPVITVRVAHAGEKMTTLDGVARELDESMLMITDTLGSIAVAGVMGGSQTEVSESTRTILLESATFESINNRRTAQKLKLHSEASQRFSRGIPAQLNALAARRAAHLMRDYAGGSVVPGMVDAYPVRQRERVVYTTASDVHRLLGMHVDLATMIAGLRRLDMRCTVLAELPPSCTEADEATCGLQRAPGEPVLQVVAPWHRLDIQVPADLCEEVARLIGYEAITTTLMSDVLPPPHINANWRTEEQIRDILTGCGLMETINYALTTPENHDRLARAQIGTAGREQRFITLLNPLNVNRRVMRRSLLVSALENAAYNYRYTQRLANFEIGRIYLPEKGEQKLPQEERRLSILLTGRRRPASVHADPAGAELCDFFDVKGVLETLFARLGLASNCIEYVARDGAPTFAAACTEIRIHGAVQGVLGEIHPLVLQAFDLPTSARVFVADLAIAPLVKPSWHLQPMRPISIYQPVIEDLAFVVDEEVTSAAVQTAMRQAGGSLLAHVELFDIYRGQPIAPGQKSLAYQLTYENPEGNLSESRVQDLRKRIIRRVASSPGGRLRE